MILSPHWFISHGVFDGYFAIGVVVSSMVGYATWPVAGSAAVKVAVTKIKRPEMYPKLEGVCF